ncbi:Disease resistance protein rph8a [Thalictrum thalictroides]|uniref:Disease resistance protein rph8a n=1 Tax=Thalictrum thalictroides TaxID=46969 RepID=A0A7J6X8V0_THATH|nr:Disease resistance protein rph8a [Thalictrum thalictroides]
MTDLVKLTNLEKLGIRELDDETMELLTIAIRGGGLDKLRSLYLFVVNGVFFSDLLLEVLSEKHYLQKLELRGEMKKLPSKLPSNLIKLTLARTDLSEDPMPTLENLQQLLSLRLNYSYEVKQMVCSTKGFPKLQHLEVSFFSQLDELVVEEGAMPCLLTCEISMMPELKMVPQGFKFLTRLQELKISTMRESFVQRVKEGGEDWDTIKQIPSIIVKDVLEEDRRRRIVTKYVF